VKRLHLGIVGIRDSGERFGRATRDVGRVPKGTSTVRVAEMTRQLCQSPAPFTVRIRAVYGAKGAGHVAQIISRRSACQEDRLTATNQAAPSRPLRTIIVGPIGSPDLARRTRDGTAEEPNPARRARPGRSARKSRADLA
jgi:hypothetical protein